MSGIFNSYNGIRKHYRNLKAYSQLEPFTLLHADELTKEQVRDSSLQTRAFYVADFPLYSLEGEQQTPTLWLARHTATESHNLVLRHLNDEVNSSYDQLVQTGNYRPNAEEARDVMTAESTLRVDLTKLTLNGDDKQWCYLEINTTNYNSLNIEERALAERFYGQGDNFVVAMKLLKEAGVDNTRVYVLNPEYVKEHAKDSPVGRASWLDYFNYGSYFVASDHGVNDLGALCGVRRVVVPAGDAPKKLEVPVVPSAPQETTERIRSPTMEEILAVSRIHVPEFGWEQFRAEIEKLYTVNSL